MVFSIFALGLFLLAAGASRFPYAFFAQCMSMPIASPKIWRGLCDNGLSKNYKMFICHIFLVLPKPESTQVIELLFMQNPTVILPSIVFTKLSSKSLQGVPM